MLSSRRDTKKVNQSVPALQGWRPNYLPVTQDTHKLLRAESSGGSPREKALGGGGQDRLLHGTWGLRLEEVREARRGRQGWHSRYGAQLGKKGTEEEGSASWARSCRKGFRCQAQNFHLVAEVRGGQS